MNWDTKPLNAAFKMMRRFGLVARRNFLCCQNCGVHAIATEYEEADKDAKPLGYAFYHRQDHDGLVESGSACIAYNAFGVGDSAAVGRIIEHCLNQAGVRTEWNGSVSQKIKFFLQRKEVLV